MADPPLLAITGLRKTFDRNGRKTQALDGIDLTLAPGEIFAIAGPSGCGKSTLARCILRLIEPDAGTIAFAGTDLLATTGTPLRRLRRRIQMVFQDPHAALNPRATIGRILTDPLRLHGLVPRADRPREVLALMDRVGLPASLRDQHPHALSGGQRQRVAIARAIACRPDLIVLDEPVSALDVSVRARIINLLLDLRNETGISYLLISHDLALVNAIAARVAIMQDGRIVETGHTAGVFANPQNDATIRLLNAVPKLRLEASPSTPRP